MRYTRGTTLLPFSPTELRRTERVPFHDLPSDRLLIYDESVSDFDFEYQPQQDIELFLQHAHFAGISAGRLVACQEDLFGVAAQQPLLESPPVLVVDPETVLPPPLEYNPVARAFAEIGRESEWRGLLTLCSCGIGFCFSQYAWVRESLCISLFTINSARFAAVEWLPFWIAVVSQDAVEPPDDRALDQRAKRLVKRLLKQGGPCRTRRST
jgi:hypothetical protein